jgi:YHS domain-containing protein
MFRKSAGFTILASLCTGIATLAIAGGPIESAPGAAAEQTPINCIYSLPTCPVSDEPVAEGDSAVIRVFDGREVRFCCEMCVAKFEADKAKYWAKIDAQVIEQQRPLYPLTQCVVVPDDALIVDEVDMGVNYVYGNRLARFCCKGCIKGFKKEPATFLAAIDAAIIEAQVKDYPLETCLVSGHKLDAMGKPYDVVVGGRLIRLCCADCLPKLRESPAHYIAMVDQARAKAAKAN